MIPKVRKAVFPAAGLGTRFLPATKAQPKEMLPLVDKPIIQYGVEEAVAAGGRLLKPAEEAFWGGYPGYFCDPDGFLWEVVWNPSFPVAEDGSIRIPE